MSLNNNEGEKRFIDMVPGPIKLLIIPITIAAGYIAAGIPGAVTVGAIRYYIGDSFY